MFIEQPPLWFRWIYPDALWRLDKKHRAVFLTFDDGPWKYTEQLLTLDIRWENPPEEA